MSDFALCQRSPVTDSRIGRTHPAARIRKVRDAAGGRSENAVISFPPLRSESAGSRTMSLENDVARTILDGFDKHYRLFREAAVRAKTFFENADWMASRTLNRERIHMYDLRVNEAVATITERFPEIARREDLWPEI